MVQLRPYLAPNLFDHIWTCIISLQGIGHRTDIKKIEIKWVTVVGSTSNRTTDIPVDRVLRHESLTMHIATAEKIEYKTLIGVHIRVFGV
jgi:hypothetical protein